MLSTYTCGGGVGQNFEENLRRTRRDEPDRGYTLLQILDPDA